MNYWMFLLASFLLIADGLYTEQDTRSVLTALHANTHAAEIPTTSLEDLSSRYDAFLLDAYGVFWGSSEVGVLPGAAAAMEYLVSQGKHVGILSNSTQLAAKEKDK